MSMLSGRYRFDFMRNCPKVLQSGCNISYSHQAYMRVSIFSHILTLGIDNLKFFSHSNNRKIQINFFSLIYYYL